MKFVFHAREPLDKQYVLAQALIQGASHYKDEIYLVGGLPKVVEDVDGVVMLGIGGLGDQHARLIYDAYKDAGKHVVFLDKGYTRNDNFRIAVNAFQPTEYLMEHQYPASRFQSLIMRFPGYQMFGRKVILFDGASEKYCAWYRFGEWRDWGVSIVDKIKQYTDRHIVYRPRPGRNGLPLIPGTETSCSDLRDDLARAWVVVSWGGNIGWDSAMSGTPHFAMGDSIARPVSETDWNFIDRPYRPRYQDWLNWASNVVHCQYSLQECESGQAWGYVRDVLRRQGYEVPLAVE